MAISEKRKTGFAPYRSPVTIHFSPSEESAPGVTRTPDRRIRNPLLYPAELRAQIEEKSSCARIHCNHHRCRCSRWIDFCTAQQDDGTDEFALCHRALQIRRLVGV